MDGGRLLKDLGLQDAIDLYGEKTISPRSHPAEGGHKKFRKERGMGVRGKGEREALFKRFPFPLPTAAGGWRHPPP
jgi:hypothetical protein